jgi:hypothetical protein
MYLLVAIALIAVLFSSRLFQRAFPFESLSAFGVAMVVVFVLLRLGRAG